MPVDRAPPTPLTDTSDYENDRQFYKEPHMDKTRAPKQARTMSGLIIDYAGVLDGSDEARRRWRDLLEALRAHGTALAVLSNDPGGDGAEHIRELEYRGLVDAVLLSGEIGYEKPDEEAFRIAADTLGVPMNDCVMVDDSIINVRGAVDAGLIGCYYQQFDRTVVEVCGLFGLKGEF